MEYLQSRKPKKSREILPPKDDGIEPRTIKGI